MMSKRLHTSLKGQLTRAQNTGDPWKVLDACNAAFQHFEDSGYPDTWHRWNIAKRDAETAIARDSYHGRTLRAMHTRH